MWSCGPSSDSHSFLFLIIFTKYTFGQTFHPLQQKAVNLVKDALVSFKKQDLAMEHKQEQRKLRALSLMAPQPYGKKQQPDHDEEAYNFLAVYIIMKY